MINKLTTSPNSSTTSLSLTKLVCTIPNIQEEIIKLAENKNTDPLYLKFVKKFFNYVPADYIKSEKIGLFNQFAQEAFEFFKGTKLKNRRLSIKSSLIKADPAITILLVSNNKPFIVDSLTSLLNRLNLQPKFIFHPVLLCARNKDGVLQNMGSDTNSDSLESLVSIKILGNFDKDSIDKLENIINYTLDQVEQANNSWQNLLNTIEKFIDNFKNNEATYAGLESPVKESIDFLNWLTNNNFTFLGKVDFELNNDTLKQEGAIGIWQDNIDEIKNIIEFSETPEHNNKLIILGRINAISSVHRSNLVDYILVKNLDSSGKYKSGTIILGLYSSMLYYQSIRNIPILRKKLHFVLDKAGFSSNGYNYKKLKIIIEALPREAIIQIHNEDLYCMSLHMLSSMMSKKLKLFIQQDYSGAFVNVLIFLPRERLTPNVHNAITKYLSQKFSGTILTNYTTEVAQLFSYLFITIAVDEKLDCRSEEIESDIDQISTLWHDSVYQKLAEELGEYKAGQEITLLDPIFPNDYKHKYNSTQALEDITYFKRASIENKPLFNLSMVSENDFTLRIYSPNNPIALFNVLPSIENLGFKAIDERSFHIKSGSDIQESWLYEFILTSLTPFKGDITALKNNVEEALEKMRIGALAVDSLSKLIVLAELNWREIKLLKALTRYLHQTAFTYGKGYVQLVLIKHYGYTKLLVEFFDLKFNPVIERSEIKIQNITNKIKAYLNKVSVSSEDKVLRHMFNLIEAIVRTNCYQQIDGQEKNYVSFKFNSKAILDLTRPVPHAEIFVYSNDFEAIHLRGGKVARGGIRWSDRGEDYRTEVLGLMKAQMAKNTVIVPVGSKGGFFLLFNREDYTPEEYKNKTVECYQNFLRGLLDITDNIIAGKIVKPADTVVYDDDDPYLVVAADKGTATFSDYANNISAEYSFWLADAFASGGSAGYDHKKMGITAKGAWISVVKHFEKMGIDPQTNPISVVGIGDMSGDVFGNGLLCSKAIKLVAAFNHMHIFIDPNPDLQSSFKERKRLFNVPYSKWSDYDVKLISKGGGIFERTSKTIKLTKEIKDLLEISVDEITPEDLIKTILKAKVDLIWNGGIGTYVKASHESHLEIGDKANDLLRCNGKEIRAKIIAEGGNLGVSQQGRIEYSQIGGLINTDFIDNSAGVDCSDHEVNIKIAMNIAVQSKELEIKARNKLLASMTNEVEQLVLLDNYKQTQAITIAHSSPAFTIESFSNLIDVLEEDGLLDRAVEFLPSREELNKRVNLKQALTRPELAVLLSYSKMSCYNELANFDLFADSYFDSYLINYFPPEMHDKFKKEIISHPLRNEIIRTVITNKIINQLGGVIINTIKKEAGSNLADIISNYIIVCEIFDLDILWEKVEKLGANIDYHIKIDMFTELTKIMRRGISWFIKNRKEKVNIEKTIIEFGAHAKNLSKTVSGLLSGESKIKFDDRIERYLNAGISKELAIQISTLDSLISVFDIIFIAGVSNVSYEQVANLYFTIGNYFQIDWLRKACDKLIDDSYWNRLSIQSLKDDLYDKQKAILIKITHHNKNIEIDLNNWINDNKTTVSIFTEFIANIKLHENINLNMIILANKKFDMVLRKLA